MSEADERRRFVRLEVPDGATAVDHTGRELGRVVNTGAGGIAVQLNGNADSFTLEPGLRMRITVVEEGITDSPQLETEVRYRRGDTVGMQFL